MGIKESKIKMNEQSKNIIERKETSLMVEIANDKLIVVKKVKTICSFFGTTYLSPCLRVIANGRCLEPAYSSSHTPYLF
jgi:hypothetical protein